MELPRPVGIGSAWHLRTQCWPELSGYLAHSLETANHFSFQLLIIFHNVPQGEKWENNLAHRQLKICLDFRLADCLERCQKKAFNLNTLHRDNCGMNWFYHHLCVRWSKCLLKSLSRASPKSTHIFQLSVSEKHTVKNSHFPPWSTM